MATREFEVREVLHAGEGPLSPHVETVIGARDHRHAAEEIGAESLRKDFGGMEYVPNDSGGSFYYAVREVGDSTVRFYRVHGVLVVETETNEQDPPQGVVW